MKTLLTFTAAAFIFTAVSAQQRTATPQPLPMAAPAMKVQNTQNSQNSTAPKSTGTGTETKEAKKGTADKSAEAAPPVDNKIAVSDPGAPGDKANTKKASGTQSSDKKAAPTTGVSPK